MFEDEYETIASRVLREFDSPAPNWTSYTLDEIQRAYAGLIGWRKQQRKRKHKDQLAWEQNGEHIRIIQSVLAGKWAERGKPALLEKILTMSANCANPDRINNYDDLLLAELREAYAKMKADGQRE